MVSLTRRAPALPGSPSSPSSPSSPKRAPGPALPARDDALPALPALPALSEDTKLRALPTRLSQMRAWETVPRPPNASVGDRSLPQMRAWETERSPKCERGRPRAPPNASVGDRTLPQMRAWETEQGSGRKLPTKSGSPKVYQRPLPWLEVPCPPETTLTSYVATAIYCRLLGAV